MIRFLPMNVDISGAVVYVPRVITAKQIRAARAMVGWTQDKLASEAGLSLAVVNNVERDVTDPRRSTINAIQMALENAGVEFLAERQNSPDGGQGVRLRKEF